MSGPGDAFAADHRLHRFSRYAVAGAVEMALELEQPFAGVLHISPLPMHKMVYGLNELNSPI
jgi:hypothetical protein